MNTIGEKEFLDKALDARIEVLPKARRLPEWKPSIRSQQSLARIREITTAWVRKTEETAYLLGKEFVWLKNKLRGTGEFTSAVIASGHTMRTVQRLMVHARDCDAVNRLLPYHPNRKNKGDTVSLLEPPEIDDKSELDIKKPRHDSEPLNWNAHECAETLLKIFEKITARRSVEDMHDVLAAFEELSVAFVNEREDDKRMSREEVEP